MIDFALKHNGFVGKKFRYTNTELVPQCQYSKILNALYNAIEPNPR